MKCAKHIENLKYSNVNLKQNQLHYCKHCVYVFIAQLDCSCMCLMGAVNCSELWSEKQASSLNDKTTSVSLSPDSHIQKGGGRKSLKSICQLFGPHNNGSQRGDKQLSVFQ